MTRLLRLLLVVLAIAVAGIGLRLFLTSRPVEVEVARPESDVAVAVFGLGTQEARISTRLGFETQAALVEVRVDHGDRVKAGDLLARLDDGEARARLDKSQAGVVAAEAGGEFGVFVDEQPADGFGFEALGVAGVLEEELAAEKIFEFALVGAVAACGAGEGSAGGVGFF